MVARALDAARGPSQAGLALQWDRDGAAAGQLRLGAVRIGPANGSPQVWLAQTVDGAKTRVRAGENGGLTLSHDRVVTKLWGPWPLDARGAQRLMDVTPPGGAPREQLRFVAFVQDRSDGDTLQSLGLALASCPLGARQ